jgi:hypothetical protein
MPANFSTPSPGAGAFAAAQPNPMAAFVTALLASQAQSQQAQQQKQQQQLVALQIQQQQQALQNNPINQKIDEMKAIGAMLPPALQAQFMQQMMPQLQQMDPSLSGIKMDASQIPTIGGLAQQLDPAKAPFLPQPEAAQTYDPNDAIGATAKVQTEFDKMKNDVQSEAKSAGGFANYLANPQNVPKAAAVLGLAPASPGYKPKYNEILATDPNGKAYVMRISPQDISTEKPDAFAAARDYFNDAIANNGKDPKKVAEDVKNLKKYNMTPNEAYSMLLNDPKFAAMMTALKLPVGTEEAQAKITESKNKEKNAPAESEHLRLENEKLKGEVNKLKNPPKPIAVDKMRSFFQQVDSSNTDQELDEAELTLKQGLNNNQMIQSDYALGMKKVAQRRQQLHKKKHFMDK